MARTSALSARDSSDDRYFEANTALNRVLLEAPFLPRCSDDKSASLVRPRQYALRWPYMQVNRPEVTSWLIFDLDHPNPFIWQDADLPPPNLIVQNRESGTSHLYYAIVPVCRTERARSRPIDYMRAIYTEMAIRLKADVDYRSGPVAKTPGHPWWITTELHAREYELGTLADYLELPKPKPWSKGPQVEEKAHSRHCVLFELLRYYAYSIVQQEREHGSLEHFTRLLEGYCLNNNGKVLEITASSKGELPWSSIKATVKSVARWTWDHYTGQGGCHRGVMALDKNLPLSERQRLAAERTHKLRGKAMESKIRAACRQLQAAGQALAQAAVARIAGVTRQTVAAYRHVLEEVVKPAAIAVLGASSADGGHVNYGAHQVSAALGGGGDLPGFGAVAVQGDGDRTRRGPRKPRGGTGSSSP